MNLKDYLKGLGWIMLFMVALPFVVKGFFVYCAWVATFFNP